MPVVVGVTQPVRWWEWVEITSAEQLSWLPVDYVLRDTAGVECRAVGVGVAPPVGWERCDTADAYSPRLPARVI
ncbi:hypothetical protein CCUG60884_00264 [Mycobacteroides salmoniphilum]|uniref:Uncharacterized protein n=1 Tax=Mycobacteroides salmoniphilum TaxID=404941 RepID=A0A4R8SZQ1_9MYCO|nr:hypothetical protein CCUG60884_00264 [Mycobacteroides salmoniphilum]